MRFRQWFLAAGVQPAEVRGDGDFHGLSADSRRITRREVFACMPSANSDTHRFVSDALAAGAAGVLVHSREALASAPDSVPAAYITEDRWSESIWRLAREAYAHPSRTLRVVGVTGTNGKTTVAWLMRDMLETMGEPCAYLGTLGFHLQGEERPLPNTTPIAIDVQRMLAEARDRGVRSLACEVSSHALDQRRIDGVAFDAAVFTNLTQDHLDYHGDLERYAKAKRRLFEELPAQGGKDFRAAFHLEDPRGREWRTDFSEVGFGFGRTDGELRYDPVEVRSDGLSARMQWEGESRVLHSRLGGSFNVENCAAAVAGLLAAGVDFAAVAPALAFARPVPGRFETVPNAAGLDVVIDYAHTPDALRRLLATCRELGPERIVAVFGCGGDRDRTKRPLMARAVSESADLTIATSDNPRTEDPQSILDEVVAGMAPGSQWQAILDRREAIRAAVRATRPGDMLVIAGKGHETYQIVGREKLPMDDRDLVRDALEAPV